jgi:DMSO/TMAO reductase YedYZ molybdopterin-dependent catalytic subunit
MSGTNMRFINTSILVLISILGLTGLYGLVWPFPSILFEIHRTAAWGLILLIPWKVIISVRSLKRRLDPRPDRNVVIFVSLILAIATLTVIFFGLVWKWNLSEYYFWIGKYAYTPIGWHWGIAIGLAPFFLLHIYRRWPRPKRADFTQRRQALKLLGIGVAAIAGWGLSEALAKTLEDDGILRRFTGSRESGSFTGLDYPVTSGANQGVIRLSPETWRLRITGAVASPLDFIYQDILALSASELVATLDCTGGWYSTQAWQGVPLTKLLEQAKIQSEWIGIRLTGVLDYSARFTLTEAREILLATYVGGLILDHRHGYPLRAVVPSRRGWHWVKWMTEIEVIAF